MFWLFAAGHSMAGSGNDSIQVKKEQKYPILKPAGFTQQHFTIDNAQENPLNFSIHRARLGFKAQFNEKIKINLIIGALEPPDRKPALVNAFADISINPMFNFRTGQFLVPFGIEGPEPIFLNPAIERSYPTRKMNTYRMFRDIGIMVYGKYSFLSYSFAVLNGNGANVSENINPKDFVLRTIFTLYPGFEAGVSGQIGIYATDSLGNLNRQRWAVHIKYDKRSVFLRSEFMTLRIEPVRDTDRKNSLGGYLLGGYRFSKKWNVFGNVEYYQPDNKGTQNHQGFTLGSNYFITDHTRLSINGIAYTDTGIFSNLQFMLNVQLQFVL